MFASLFRIATYTAMVAISKVPSVTYPRQLQVGQVAEARIHVFLHTVLSNHRNSCDAFVTTLEGASSKPHKW